MDKQAVVQVLTDGRRVIGEPSAEAVARLDAAIDAHEAEQAAAETRLSEAIETHKRMLDARHKARLVAYGAVNWPYA